MSEPSNTSVQGLLSSLNASGKSAVAKGEIRQGSGDQDRKSFSHELDQALEQQSAGASLSADKPLKTRDGRSVIVADAPGTAAALVNSGDQELPEQLATRVVLDTRDESLPNISISKTVGEAVITDDAVVASSATAPVSVKTRVADPVAGSTPVSVMTTVSIPDTSAGPTAELTSGQVAAEVTEVSTALLTGNVEPLSAGAVMDAESLPLLEDGDQTGLPVRSDVVDRMSATPAPPAVAGTADLVKAEPVSVRDKTVSDAAQVGSARPVDTASASTAPLTTAESQANPTSVQAAQTPATRVTTAGTDVDSRGGDGLEPRQGQVSTVAVNVVDTTPRGASDARITATLMADRRSATSMAGSTAGSSALGSSIDAAAPVGRADRSAPVMQPAEVGEVISQASLAARYRHVTNVSDSRVSTSVIDDDQSALPTSGIGLDGKAVQANQRVIASGQPGNSLTARSAEGQGGAQTTQPWTDGMTLDDSEPVLHHADLLKDLQTQRAALKETVPLPGTTMSADSMIKAGSVDNMFLPTTGGIVAAPVVQRADAVFTAPVSAPLDLSLLAEDADIAMADNVRWMVKEGVQNATVTVSPAGMGPISVKVGIEQDQMSVSIVALQHTTREALDALLPRLREQLASQGHDSVKLDVSDGRGEQSRGGNGQMFAGTRNPSDTWTQGEQGSSGGNGNRKEYGDSSDSTGTADQHMAEDLQRVAIRTAGGSRTSSVFDTYV